jgi:uncharacterized protein (TIGR03032 family)
MNSSRDSVQIECAATTSFQEWFAQAGGSLAFTTYQAGKLAMIGWGGTQVSLLMRQFDRPLGMVVQDGRLVLATRDDVWVFANAPGLAPGYPGQEPGRYDALYLPRTTYHTGDLHTHDLGLSPNGDIIIVACRFSCLARLSGDFSFVPVWKPPFISDLVPEDRCHLNGLAMRDARPRYVTALGTTDTAGAWRERKATGGVVLDVETNEILLDGLSMPHSPRWHQDRLWLLNSGEGQLLTLDPSTKRTEVVCELPGYLRGLCFVGGHAIIGLCKIREKHIFGGLPVQQRNDKLRCGLAVVDLQSGQEVAMFEFTGGCEEIYDIQFLPGIYRPTILNLDRPVVRDALTNPESSFWLRPVDAQSPGAASNLAGVEGWETSTVLNN